MTKRKSDLDRLVSRLEAARTALADAIMAEMDRAARECDLDEMAFHFTTRLVRAGEEVECSRIAELERLFLEKLNPNGVLGLWRRSAGWYHYR